MSHPKLELTYFALPGRGEIARLSFLLGKISFTDTRINFADWPALKAKQPFGQIPILTVDGTPVAQSAAIDHYAARLAGLLPEDPVAALLSDQAYFFVLLDIHNALIAPTNRITDPEEQLAARKALAEGPLKDRLAQLTRLVEGRRGKFIAGDKLSIGDLSIFAFLSNLRSGWLKGIPVDILDSFPALKAFRNSVATMPDIAAYYAAATDDVRKNGYTPDP